MRTEPGDTANIGISDMNQRWDNDDLAPSFNDVRALQILSAARDLFLQAGWDGFSMETVAEAADCSRPLVYKHFTSKEDVLIALALQSRWRRVRLSRLALQFNGRPRERIIAYGLTNNLLAARDMPVELFVASAKLRSKVSEERVNKLKAMGSEVVLPAVQIISGAVDDGDLVLPEGLTPHGLCFVFWASRWGATYIMDSDTPLEDYGIKSPDLSMNLALNTLMDGLDWKPLSTEWDYMATVQRIYAEVFPEDAVSKILKH